MQEKTNILSTKTSTRRFTTKEERQLQVANWKKSGLTMSEYCRQNNLALASLSEWKHSILRNKTSSFKSVQPLPPIDLIKPNNIVEIILDHRVKIRLQQVTDVSLIINIAKGLMSCN